MIVLAGLSELQRRQLVLADNRIALNAGWDLAMLKLELADLKGLGADLSALGFDAKELAAAFGQTLPGLTDENAVPEAQDVAVAAPRDIWLETFGASGPIGSPVAMPRTRAPWQQCWLAASRS